MKKNLILILVTVFCALSSLNAGVPVSGKFINEEDFLVTSPTPGSFGFCVTLRPENANTVLYRTIVTLPVSGGMEPLSAGDPEHLLFMFDNVEAGTYRLEVDEFGYPGMEPIYTCLSGSKTITVGTTDFVENVTLTEGPSGIAALPSHWDMGINWNGNPNDKGSDMSYDDAVNVKISCYSKFGEFIDQAFLLTPESENPIASFFFAGLSLDTLMFVASLPGYYNDTLWYRPTAEDLSYYEDGEGTPLEFSAYSILGCFRFKAEPTFAITKILRADNEIAAFAKLEFINTLTNEKISTYEKLGRAKDGDDFYLQQLPAGTYTINIYTQGECKTYTDFVHTKDTVLEEVVTAVDTKSAFIGVAAYKQTGEILWENPELSYSLDNKTSWNTFPKDVMGQYIMDINMNPMFHYYGNSNIDIAVNAPEFAGDTSTITSAKYITNTAANYVHKVILKGVEDTISISGVVGLLDDKWNIIPTPNATMTIYEDPNEYAEVVVKATADAEGQFSFKFVGQLKAYGVEFSDPSGKLVENNNDGSYRKKLDIFEREMTYAGDMKLYQPAVVNLKAQQSAKGAAEVKLTWEIPSKVAALGIEVEKYIIYRNEKIDGEWGMFASEIASITDDTIAKIFSFVDNEDNNTDYPPTLGTEYQYDIEAVYKGGDESGTRWSWGNEMAYVVMKDLSYTLQVIPTFATNENFENNILSLQRAETDEAPAIRIDKVFKDMVLVNEIPAGTYTLLVNGKEQSYKGTILIDKDSVVRVDLAADATSNLLKVNVLNSLNGIVKNAKIRAVSEDVVIDFVYADAAVLVLPKAAYKLVVSAIGYMTYTVDVTIDATFTEKSITLNDDLGETVYFYGKFNIENTGFKDIVGKTIKIEQKASGRIFESKNTIDAEGNFVFEKLSIGDLTWIFPTTNITTGLQPMGPGGVIETNDFTISNEGYDGEIVDSIQYFFGYGDALPIIRKSFTIAGAIAQQGQTALLADVSLAINSIKDNVSVSFSLGDMAQFELEGFKGNDTFHFVVKSAGYKTIDTNVIIKNREIIGSESNVFSLPSFTLRPELSAMRAEGKVCKVNTEEGIATVTVNLFNPEGTKVGTALTDAQGNFAFDFQGYYNTGINYTFKTAHSAYLEKVEVVKANSPKITVSLGVAERQTVVLTISSNNTTYGTVAISGKSDLTTTFKQGDTVTIVATPVADKGRFVDWKQAATVFSTEATHTFVINDTMTLLAEFVPLIGIEDDAPFASVNMYASNGTIYIQGLTANSRVEILDLLGRTLENLTSSASYAIQVPNTGIYIVRLTNGEGTVSRKLIVK